MKLYRFLVDVTQRAVDRFAGPARRFASSLGSAADARTGASMSKLMFDRSVQKLTRWSGWMTAALAVALVAGCGGGADMSGNRASPTLAAASQQDQIAALALAQQSLGARIARPEALAAVSSGAVSDAPPPPPDTNLVSNGGFEAGMAGWADWGNTHVVNGQANSGTSALSVGTAAGGAGQEVGGIVPGTRYRLVAHAMVSYPTEAIFVGVNFVDAAGNGLEIRVAWVSSTTYTPASLDITAPPGAVKAVVFAWKNQGSGFGYLDDVLFGVAPSSVPPLRTSSGNVVVNGGFESGLANWENWGNAVASPQAAAGAAAAQVGAAAGGIGQYDGGIVAGSTYRLSAQVQVSRPDELGYLGVKFLDASGNAVLDSIVPFRSTTYSTAKLEVTAPANATRALVYVWKNAGTGFAAVDEIALARVATPPGVDEIVDGYGGSLKMTLLATGGYALSWLGPALTPSFFPPYPVMVRIFDSSGNPLIAAQQVGTTQSFKSCCVGWPLPVSAALTGGGYVIAWYGPQGNLLSQPFAADGNPIGTSRVSGLTGLNPQVVRLTAGGYMLASGVTSVGVRAYAADATELGPARIVVVGPPPPPTSWVGFDLAALPDGGAVVSGTISPDGGPDRPFVVHLAPDGSPV